MIGGPGCVAPIVRIDVWSDVICPWCFLGKRRLERALDEADLAGRVTVRWRAYQLDPRATDTPGDLRVALERKYGPGAFDGMTRRLTALGAAEGIDFRFDRALRVSTLDAHRLLAWAWERGGAPAQGALAERLFRAYFIDGANVADHPTLVHQVQRVQRGADAETGASVLDPDEAASVLASDLHADEVATEVAEARDRLITGVPAFVVEDRLLIPGAQEVETFVSILTRAAERFAPEPAVAPGTVDGDACDVDDPRC